MSENNFIMALEKLSSQKNLRRENHLSLIVQTLLSALSARSLKSLIDKLMCPFPLVKGSPQENTSLLFFSFPKREMKSRTSLTLLL